MKMETREIKVKPVTRYIITEYHSKTFEDTDMAQAGSCCLGEYYNPEQANRIAEIIAKDTGASLQKVCYRKN